MPGWILTVPSTDLPGGLSGCSGLSSGIGGRYHSVRCMHTSVEPRRGGLGPPPEELFLNETWLLDQVLDLLRRVNERQPRVMCVRIFADPQPGKFPRHRIGAVQQCPDRRTFNSLDFQAEPV